MIPLFQLNQEQQNELNKKIEELGPIHPFHDQGKIMGIILEFHESIFIGLLKNEDQT